MLCVSLVDFSSIHEILMVFGLLVIIVFLRYVLVCLVFELAFNVVWKKKYQEMRVNTKLSKKPGQEKREIYWSLLTSLLFGCSFLFLIYAWQEGWTQIYTSFSAIEIFAIPVSIFIYLFVQDAYYYWLHRWMHKPHIYRYVHKVHHMSVVSTPWTSFSFHPIETLLQAITLPLLVFVIPIHSVALLLLLVIMTVAAVINHLDIEIYPNWLLEHRHGKYLIGATHHSKHHSRFLFNYGLYFSFWDHWMGTELEDTRLQ